MADECSLYDAKAKLSALVRQVREGRTIVITVHGEPAAELRPIERGARKQSLAERVEELESRGELSAPTRRSGASVALRRLARRPGALKRFLKERE
ncbi:MAG: type II toxin-antitoxin system prevent-host-death family antitoxin [Gemmatimonadaceae bacterium]|nr:type II toxin-antitoxin system prevent-host-death family antitoxin [Gemmatimonadaceae bacterium]